MKKIPNKGKAKIKKGYAYVEDGSPTGRNITSFQEAGSIDAQCGCGIDCLCDGLIAMPLRSVTTGLIIDYVGMYFTTVDDGTTITTVVEPIDVARANIAALKAL